MRSEEPALDSCFCLSTENALDAEQSDIVHGRYSEMMNGIYRYNEFAIMP